MVQVFCGTVHDFRAGVAINYNGAFNQNFKTGIQYNNLMILFRLNYRITVGRQIFVSISYTRSTQKTEPGNPCPGKQTGGHLPDNKFSLATVNDSIQEQLPQHPLLLVLSSSHLLMLSVDGMLPECTTVPSITMPGVADTPYLLISASSPIFSRITLIPLAMAASLIKCMVASELASPIPNILIVFIY